ncbi:DsbA family protein [Roseibium sp.]|uniref:DsbA family protein n=1 Tax=Roseibium sp. TaxID=1936156 RepID=UPI003D132640
MTLKCDPETGTCLVGEDSDRHAPETVQNILVTYAGDPMCSWCWGMSPVVSDLAEWCTQHDIGFRLLMGGLRPGGGDPWNEAFRTFLRNEWQTIAARTGQPFGYRLLEREHFNYDTEPACRAVVTARSMLEGQPDSCGRELRFFSAVQRKFYVGGDDPKELEFYEDICVSVGLEVKTFEDRFRSPEATSETLRDFRMVRQLGIRGFPAIVLQDRDDVHPVSEGYAPLPQLTARLKALGAG